MDLNKFLARNWTYSYTRRMTYQSIRLYHYGYWKGFLDIFGYKQGFELYRYINGDCFVYFDKNEALGLAKHLSDKFTDKNFIVKTVRKLPEKINKDFDAYLSFVEKMPQNLTNFSNDKLVNTLETFFNKQKTLSINFWILFTNVEVALNLAVRELMESKKIASSRIDELVSKLSEPIKIIPIDMEKLSLLRIALLNKGKQASALKRHWKNYAYMPVYDIDYNPYNLDYFREKLEDINKKLSKDEIKKEINTIKNKYKERYTNYLRIIKEFDRQKEILYLLQFFAAYGYLKDYKPYFRDKGSLFAKCLFNEIAKRLNLTLKEALFLDEEEMVKSLKHKTSIKPEELKRRIVNSVYLCEDDKVYLVTDKDVLDRIDELLDKKEEIKELKGMGVSKGFTKGKVSIVLSNNDFHKFKEGEILVTSATRPDFVPLIKKANGIITDEGGVLSHAAIVSRELHKPCIVGTIKATRTLKDGDLVEVDANKGIVKILKR